MKLLSNIFRVAYFSIFLKLLHGYLLFAANLDDFHTIAKKLVPEEFVDSLKKIEFNPITKDYENSDETEKVYELRETNDNRQKRGKKPNKLSKIHLNSDATIDFDELVERVKKRLEKELKDKLTVIKDIKTEVDETTKLQYLTTRKQVVGLDDKSEYVDDITDRPTKYSHVVTTKTVTERYEYADALESTYSKNKKKVTKKEKDYDEFKKIEMIKNDSYEDYKTPSKDSFIYSSKENKRFKIKKSSKSRENVRKPVKIVKSRNKPAHEEELDLEEEVKARTENIVYDDNFSSSNVKKLKLGTFRPTRERYTIVTPNYVSPMGAERYDFNEPLPEKDREREKLKYFGNPPARINKKVFI